MHRVHIYTVHIYICIHTGMLLATQIAVRHSEHPHKQSQHPWPHPAPLSGCTGWKSTDDKPCVQGGSRTPSPASGKASPCTNLAGEAVALGAGRTRRLSQLTSHGTWPLELSSLELVPVAEPGWKGNCIKLFNDESEAGRRRAVPQPPPPAEQGETPQRQPGATATSHGCSTHTGPDPANGPRGGGGPHAK